MIELRSSSPEQTRAIAAAMARLARAGDLIILSGQMGAGKTAFAQGFARALGIEEPVTSPTYTIVHSYEARSADARSMTLHHADLYRLDHTAEVADLGLDEFLEDNAIVLVEWGDVVDLGPHVQVELRVDDDAGDNDRDIVITSSDRSWTPRWERLEAVLEEWAAA